MCADSYLTRAPNVATSLVFSLLWPGMFHLVLYNPNIVMLHVGLSLAVGAILFALHMVIAFEVPICEISFLSKKASVFNTQRHDIFQWGLFASSVSQNLS